MMTAPESCWLHLKAASECSSGGSERRQRQAGSKNGAWIYVCCVVFATRNAFVWWLVLVANGMAMVFVGAIRRGSIGGSRGYRLLE